MPVRFRSLIAILFAAALAAQAPLRIEAGPLKLDVHISRTAELFHVVDQLSEWSPYCHRYYGRGMAPLNDKEKALLVRHRAVRAQRDWGEGLEQSFYTGLDLEPALAQGIHEGWLTPAQADTEREVFLGFAPRIDVLMAAQRPQLIAFRERLQKALVPLAATATSLARFVGGKPALVPVFLLADPDADNFGGGLNGGRLAMEIPTKVDPYSIFQHELFHAFLETRAPLLDKAAAGVPGLDAQTLNEGLAYAIAPGLVSDSSGHDLLLEAAQQDLAEGKTLEDPYTRFHSYALALRPLLREALKDDAQTLDTFLPRALDAWRVLTELESRRKAPATNPPAH